MVLDDLVHAGAIDVDVDITSSMVILRGTVASDAERDRAIALARETRGVTRVIDQLSVARDGSDRPGL
jgi:osmotically-inducible protein OsmY